MQYIATTRRNSFKWIALVIVLLVIVTGAALYISKYSSFGAPTHADFTGYKPTALPNGVQLRQAGLIREHNTDFNTWSFSYRLQFNRDFELYESNAKLGAAVSPSRYNSCRGLGGICNTYHAAGGVTYRVWYGVYKNAPFDVSVSCVKGNTELYLSVDKSAAANYASYNWTPFINSLQAVNLTSMPFQKVTVHNSGV